MLDNFFKFDQKNINYKNTKNIFEIIMSIS